MEKLAVVLLNFNGRKHLETFLPSVILNSQPHTIFVVDNGSNDDSVAFLKKEFPMVKLIEFDENHGFCGGYNKAISLIPFEYTILLNTDVEVTPNWIEPMFSLLKSNPQIHAVQPKILDSKIKEKFEYAGASGGYIDLLGYPFCRGRIFETLEVDHGQYDKSQKIFWASGSCLLVRKDSYLSLGGLDDDFFAHMEEIDLCWRIWNAGFEVAVVPQSIVYHLGGGTLNKSKPKKTYLNFRNGLSLLLKNERMQDLVWKLPLRIILDWIAVLKFSIQSGPQHGLAILHAHLSTLLFLPKTLNKRSKRNPNKVKPPIYQHSIALKYFIKKIKKFSDLDWNPNS